MRAARWLLPLAILLIIYQVATTYYSRRRTLAENAPAPVKPLEKDIEGRANDWVWVKSDGNRPVVEVRAKNFRQIKEPSVMELEGLELHLFHKDAKEYDLVRSDRAQFDIAGKSLYSEADVEITMGVPVDKPPHGRILKIHGSGVHFSSDDGKATTDRHVTFEFDQGGGSSTGAEYDPNTRELHLLHDVSLDWRGKSPKSPVMHGEAGEAVYKERESKVFLFPWSKMTRDTLHMEGGLSVVTLDKGKITNAEVNEAYGVRDDPGRKVEFGAVVLNLTFAGDMLVNKIVGERNARLVSTDKTARTTITGDRIDMEFDTTEKESTLSGAVSTGKSVALAEPLPKPGTAPADTRILRSDVIRMKMRPGGQYIDNVETAGPGTLDFLPNRPENPKRFLQGDRMWITYGAENHIESFRTVNASTRSEKPPKKAGDPQPPPSLTRSKELFATFDPASSELSRLEQKTDFHYDEGERHATAAHALLEQKKDLMTLDGAARAWDPTGLATADHLEMNQKSGDFSAVGHVASTRMPDPKGQSSAMLSTDEVMQARAHRMTSTESNLKIHYEGNGAEKAVAWQGANRTEADKLDIDRDSQNLEAHGRVVSQFVDKPKKEVPKAGSDKDKDKAKAKAAPKPATAPVFTVVHATDMVYTEETRIAHYTGGVTLARPDLNVAGKEMTAYLKDSSEDSSLDKVFTDGDVKIVSNRQAPRTRTGTSDHSEYYAGEEKVILKGGRPLLVDSVKGRTTGEELTWFANDDRLLVNGVEKKPTQSTILRKKK
jgi:lipopolysaccharide export system protein LptA